MKILIKIIFFLSFYLSFYGNIYGQEVVLPLYSNPEAEDFYNNQKIQPKKATSPDTLDIPFIDDFSDSHVAPDQQRWTDKQVYINSKYPVYPPSNGVATFDAYDFNGAPYQNAGSQPFIADYLTSRPINLEYPPEDSIYLSFFYQPKGIGETPDESDSLCLQFLDRESNDWTTIWAVPGSELKEFELVMIPVTSENFLYNGFQFRFFNYASHSSNQDYPDLRANVDHWNIDYVYMNNNRNISDTIFRDVCFVEPLSSILSGYESIPWLHFESAFFTQIKPFIKAVIANHDSITRNVSKRLTIRDITTGQAPYNTTPTANDLASGDTTHHLYAYDYPFNFGTGDSAILEIKATVLTDNFDYKPNDTITYIQKFKNYYALDDGSSEAGYGLRGQGSKNASVAVKFDAFEDDTLRAVDFYFNQVVDSVNLNYYFYLKVWDDNAGKPGEEVYSQLGVKPEYNKLNKFVRYYLDEPIPVSEVFYIGWTKTVDKIVNIGMDLNRNNSQRNFFNMGGWERSKFPASIMMRPVVSKKDITISAESIHETTKEFDLTVYPNPAGSYLNFRANLLPQNEYYITIRDISGRIVKRIPSVDNSRINVSDLENGLYFFSLSEEKIGLIATRKFLVSH